MFSFAMRSVFFAYPIASAIFDGESSMIIVTVRIGGEDAASENEETAVDEETDLDADK